GPQLSARWSDRYRLVAVALPELSPLSTQSKSIHTLTPTLSRFAVEGASEADRTNRVPSTAKRERVGVRACGADLSGFSLEQPLHLPVLVHEDAVGRRHSGQAGHGHDFAADHHQELGARRELQLA